MARDTLTLEQVHPVLSCPQEGTEQVRERLMRAIETTFAQGFARQFVARHSDEFGQCSTGLRTIIEDWSSGATDFESVWATPLTDMYYAAHDDRADPMRAAAGLALHLGSTGMRGRWTAALRQPACLRWEHYLLPEAEEISADHRDGVAQLGLRLPDGCPASAVFTGKHGSWTGEGAELLPGVGDHRLPRLLTSSAVPPGCSLDQDASDALVSSISPEILSAFSAAFELIRAYAPEYFPWVRRVVRDILVLRLGEGSMHSGSNSSWPGLIYMSVAEPMILAENLVHEASHQYFHLLARIEPVDDGSDTATYFSPVTGRDRPLSAILVAYHAFANVMLFLASCLKDRVEDGGYYAARRKELVPKLSRLEAPIRENPALTATGRALSEPLMKRVRLASPAQPNRSHTRRNNPDHLAP